jgi:hypothetical protein
MANVALSPSPVPSFVLDVLVDPHWCRTMEEYTALLTNHTWDLVPCPLTATWSLTIDLPPQAQVRWLLGSVQGPFVPSGFHSSSRSGLRRGLQDRCQAHYRANRACRLPRLDSPPVGRQERLPSRHCIVASSLASSTLLLRVWCVSRTVLCMASSRHHVLVIVASPSTWSPSASSRPHPVHPSARRQHRLPSLCR